MSREEDAMTLDRLEDYWLWTAVEAPTPMASIVEARSFPVPETLKEPEPELPAQELPQPQLKIASELAEAAEQSEGPPPATAESQPERPVPIATSFDKAVVLHKLGHFEEAIALYALIPDSDESYPDALVNIIAIAAARNDLSKLRDTGEKLLELRRQSRQALQALVQAAMATGDYKTAAQYGIRLVKYAADSHQAWFNLGLCYHKTGHPEQAAQAYTEALKLRPDGIRARANLGVLLQAHGDTNGARREFEQVLEIEPDNLATLWNLALIYEKDGQIAKAEKVYLRLIREEYQVYTVALRLGHLRLNRKNYMGAMEAFERCLLERSEDATAKIGLMIAKKRSGNPAETGADETLPELRETSSDSLEGMVLQAALAIETHDWRSASALENKLSGQGENTAVLVYNIGVLQQRESLLPEAIQSYKKASSQRAQFAEAHLNRGHALMECGRTEEARAAWREALEGRPGIAEDYFNRTGFPM